VHCWAPTLGEGEPPELQSDELIVAHNSRFDRWVWNKLGPPIGLPETRLEQWLCSAALASANGLPGKLSGAAKAAGASILKQPDGARLIRKFCTKSRISPNEDRTAWERFVTYCESDVGAMRELWKACRPLAREEWIEFWVSERINDRGAAVDVEFAEAAAKLGEVVEADLNRRFHRHFGFSLRNNYHKGPWLLHRVQWAVERDYKGATDALGWVTKGGVKPRGSADKSTRRELLRAIRSRSIRMPRDVTLFLLYLERAGGVASRKFQGIAQRAHDGRLRGEYAWNGAGRTGRFSSKGTQIHNLVRKSVKDEVETIEEIVYEVTRAEAAIAHRCEAAPSG
jgi:DNA polymerase